MTLCALELFSGLGGWRLALGDRGRVAAAYDINPHANATYAANHGVRPLARELATLPAAQLAAWGADTWLMSPPCQPYCRMGRLRGLEDPRSAAFLHLMDLFDVLPPRHLLLENVPGFLDSDAHRLLSDRLRRHGLQAVVISLCPTRFGIPNQRPRLYVAASHRALAVPPLPTAPPMPLGPYLDPEEDSGLYLDAALVARHGPGLDLVGPGDTRSACFIGGYGQRLVGAGSFLRTPRGIRRFSPAEIARLMGLPGDFHFPDGVSRLQQYKLLGNGLSIPVAAWVAAHLVPD